MYGNLLITFDNDSAGRMRNSSGCETQSRHQLYTNKKEQLHEKFCSLKICLKT